MNDDDDDLFHHQPIHEIDSLQFVAILKNKHKEKQVGPFEGFPSARKTYNDSGRKSIDPATYSCLVPAELFTVRCVVALQQGAHTRRRICILEIV